MNMGDLAQVLDLPEFAIQLETIHGELLKTIKSDRPEISLPAKRLASVSGKQLRSILVIACASKQARTADLTKACVAVELIHLASLVHDDIIDNSAVRRSKPTINAKEGSEQAILVGDFLTARAFELTGELDQTVTSYLAKAFREMSEGQSQELIDNYNVNRLVDSYISTINNKTASLMSAACAIGSHLGGQSANQTKAYEKFGQALGMSFQLVDDLLDFVAPQKSIGKPIMNDLKEGVYTLPVLVALTKPCRDEMRNWLEDSATKTKTAEINQLLLQNGCFEDTVNMIDKYNQEAYELVKQLNPFLAKLPDAYTKAALRQTILKP